jgi:hypothetical protein
VHEPTTGDARRPPPGVRDAERVLAAIAVVGPPAYIVLTTVLGLLWEGYDPIRDTQSELGAVDSPYRTLMNFAGFVPLGVSILAFAGAYALDVRRGLDESRGLGLHRGLDELLAVGLLLVAGVGMVVVAFFPCDPGCMDVTRSGRLHGTFSAPGAIGLPTAAMFSASVFRGDGRFGVRWQFASFWIGALALASGPIVAAGLVEGALGLVQRAGMWTPLLWMSALSARLYRDLASATRSAAP